MTIMQCLPTYACITPRGTTKGIRVHLKGEGCKVQICLLHIDEQLKDGDFTHAKKAIFKD